MPLLLGAAGARAHRVGALDHAAGGPPLAHETELLATISVALGFALVGGMVAVRLGLPAIVGYLLAGVAVGPFTPGFVADTHLAPQLAELGVILLMFGVGIHFSPRDLLAVRAVAVHFQDVGITTRAVLIIVFIFLTAPVSAHMIARAAYFVGVPFWERKARDELRDCYDRQSHALERAPSEARRPT